MKTLIALLLTSLTSLASADIYILEEEIIVDRDDRFGAQSVPVKVGVICIDGEKFAYTNKDSYRSPMVLTKMKYNTPCKD